MSMMPHDGQILNFGTNDCLYFNSLAKCNNINSKFCFFCFTFPVYVFFFLQILEKYNVPIQSHGSDG